MKETEVRGLLTLAGFTVQHMWRGENPYRFSPDTLAYALSTTLRPEDVLDLMAWQLDHPLWIVLTSDGIITIGRRKRVFEIKWEQTSLRTIVTSDKDVTNYDYLVHAWTIPKALEYLIALKAAFTAASQEKEKVDAV